MYDYQKLLGLIKEHCGTQANYAKALGIGTTTLNSRLKNQTFFKQNEILKSKELFDLKSASEVDAVFFNK